MNVIGYTTEVSGFSAGAWMKPTKVYAAEVYWRQDVLDSVQSDVKDYAFPLLFLTLQELNDSV